MVTANAVSMKAVQKVQRKENIAAHMVVANDVRKDYFLVVEQHAYK